MSQAAVERAVCVRPIAMAKRSQLKASGYVKLRAHDRDVGEQGHEDHRNSVSPGAVMTARVVIDTKPMGRSSAGLVHGGYGPETSVTN